MKKVIIGIHGLGNKPPKYLLKKWWMDAMLEGIKKQNYKIELPQFELVYWADILYDKPLNKWEKNPENSYFLDEPYYKSSNNFNVKDHSLRKKVISLISDQINKIFLNEDKTLNYGFVSDFILHKYFRDLETYYIEECKDEYDVTCKAKDLIRKRIIDVIKKYRNYDILIVAHSMGSIIAFDVLTFFLPEIKINTLITIGSPLGLPVVVSKIASEYKKRINGMNIMATPESITKNWFNLADILDKVALNYKLNDDYVANKIGISPVDFLVINDYMSGVHKNPHKSFGYLRTPEMSKILNEFIAYEKKNMADRVAKKLNKLVDKIKIKGELVKDRLNIN